MALFCRKIRTNRIGFALAPAESGVSCTGITIPTLPNSFLVKKGLVRVVYVGLAHVQPVFVLFTGVRAVVPDAGPTLR